MSAFTDYVATLPNKVGWWRQGEQSGIIVHDSGPFVINGTYFNNPILGSAPLIFGDPTTSVNYTLGGGYASIPDNPVFVSPVQGAFFARLHCMVGTHFMWVSKGASFLNGFHAKINPANGNIEVVFWNSSTYGADQFSTFFSIADGLDHSVVFRWSASVNLDVYVDANFIGSKVMAGPMGNSTGSPINFFFQENPPVQLGGGRGQDYIYFDVPISPAIIANLHNIAQTQTNVPAAPQKPRTAHRKNYVIVSWQPVLLDANGVPLTTQVSKYIVRRSSLVNESDQAILQEVSTVDAAGLVDTAMVDTSPPEDPAYRVSAFGMVESQLSDRVIATFSPTQIDDKSELLDQTLLFWDNSLWDESLWA